MFTLVENYSNFTTDECESYYKYLLENSSKKKGMNKRYIIKIYVPLKKKKNDDGGADNCITIIRMIKISLL